MNVIFHNDLAKEKYTRFWLMLAPLFVLPFVGISVFLFLIWQELRKIANKI